MTNTFSIKQKLVYRLLSLFFITWLIVTIGSLYADYRNFELEFQQNMESHLQEFLIEWTHYDASSLNPDDFLNLMPDWGQDFEQIQIWQQGKLVFSSQQQTFSLPEDQVGLISMNDNTAYVYQSPSGLTIAAKLYHDGSGRFFEGMLFEQLLPFIFLLPLLGFALYKIIDSALAPLQSVTEKITAQTPSRLEEIHLTLTPVETIPLIQAFNQLVQRLNHSFEKEQRFTANAAHELLTPLAAIKSEIQLYQQQSMNPSHNPDAIEEINLRVDRATHTVKQLLLLSRYSEYQTQAYPGSGANMHHICQEICSEMGNRLEEKQLILDFQVTRAESGAREFRRHVGFMPEPDR